LVERRVPIGAARDDLGDVRGDLHVLEECVLSTLYPFAEHGKVEFPQVDVAAGINDLRDRITALRPELSGTDAGDEYLAYLDLLDAAFTAFRAAIEAVSS
jgi:hypothetical protein